MEPLPGGYFVTAEAPIERGIREKSRGQRRRKSIIRRTPASWPLYDSRKFLCRWLRDRPSSRSRIISFNQISLGNWQRDRILYSFLTKFFYEFTTIRKSHVLIILNIVDSAWFALSLSPSLKMQLHGEIQMFKSTRMQLVLKIIIKKYTLTVTSKLS